MHCILGGGAVVPISDARECLRSSPPSHTTGLISVFTPSHRVSLVLPPFCRRGSAYKLPRQNGGGHLNFNQQIATAAVPALYLNVSLFARVSNSSTSLNYLVGSVGQSHAAPFAKGGASIIRFSIKLPPRKFHAFILVDNKCLKTIIRRLHEFRNYLWLKCHGFRAA